MATSSHRCSAALLASPACERTTIIFHDSAHSEVRRALEDLKLHEHPKVALVILDFVPGFLVRDSAETSEEVRGRVFNGLALVVLDATRHPGPVAQAKFVPVPELQRAFAETRREPPAARRSFRRRLGVR